MGTMPVLMEMTVTYSSNPNMYLIDGIDQGLITLYRGFTYTFDLTSLPSFHPFVIGTSSEGSEYNSGITTTNDIMTFTVPLDAPNTLYYYCDIHTGMGASITIESLGSVSVN